MRLQTRLAAAAGRMTSEVSRRFGAGGGSVIGGRVILALDPQALERLAGDRLVCLVSGTNGKTTTTRLLAAALATKGRVTTNRSGANLMSGLVSTLASGGPGDAAALEVDESLLPAAIRRLNPAVVVLLNLSRDQLDRVAETRLHAQAWRRALDGAPSTAVAANADDPLVVWAARAARAVTWVATGQRWRLDAYACPACGGRIAWEALTWACSACDLARPEPHITLSGESVTLSDGRHVPLALALPGWPNQANAALAAAGAEAAGVEPEVALRAMGAVSNIEGRYQIVDVSGARVRLLLAKNPAGWSETLELLRPPPLPIVVGINARVADGRDPSWLWDVPFERLAGRLVVATGDRGRDLAVRLRYADVEHAYVPGYVDAVRRATWGSGGASPPGAGPLEVDLAANYTAFQDARAELARAA